MNRLLFAVSIFAMAGYISCRKSDKTHDKPQTARQIQTQFFALPNTTPEVVRLIVANIVKQNDERHFVPKLVKKAGYPIWNKAIITSKPRASIQTDNNVVEDSNGQTVIIPMVLQDGNTTNATLVVNVGAGDTTFRLIYGKAYSRFGFTAAVNGNWSAKDIFHLFSTFDRDLFGHKVFKILDKRLFPFSNVTDTDKTVFVKLKDDHNGPVTNTIISYTSCDYYDVCYGPADYDSWCGGGCTSSCEYYSHEESVCTTHYFDTGSGSGSGSGNGGGSGSGSGGTGGSGGSGGGSGGGNGGVGNWDEELCVDDMTTLEDECQEGWETVPDPDPIPPNEDSIIAENLKRLYNKGLAMSNSLFQSAQSDKNERTFTYVINGVNDTVPMFPLEGSEYTSSPQLAYNYIGVWHTHQDEGPANRDQSFDGADINKSFYHYIINKGFPVSVITTENFIYAAVVTDPAKFKAHIRSITNSTRVDTIEVRLDALHIAAMNTCTGCTWQKKSEIGAMAITASNNSDVSGIKIFKSPRQTVNFTLLNP